MYIYIYIHIHTYINMDEHAASAGGVVTEYIQYIKM